MVLLKFPIEENLDLNFHPRHKVVGKKKRLITHLEFYFSLVRRKIIFIFSRVLFTLSKNIVKLKITHLECKMTPLKRKVLKAYSIHKASK